MSHGSMMRFRSRTSSQFNYLNFTFFGEASYVEPTPSMTVVSTAPPPMEYPYTNMGFSSMSPYIIPETNVINLSFGT